jgi:IS30 family transposase
LSGYHALVAQDKYEARRAIHRKMIVHPELKAAIEDRLKAGWSPEQIAGRMRLERHPIRVSHETIHRFAYSKDGRAEQFYRHLPEHRRRRRPRGYPPMRVSRSPSTVAPSSQPGGISRPGSAQMRGSATHKRRIKKARLRTRTTGCGSICHARPNRRR